MPQLFTHLQLSRPLAALDVETTGQSPTSDRIVEVAAVKFVPNTEWTRFTCRVNPGISVPRAATAVHGITDADVAGCLPFEAVASPLADFLGDADLCGFDLRGFDLPFLVAEFARAGVAFALVGRCVVDVLPIFRRHEPMQQGDQKGTLKFYLNRNPIRRHRAIADAIAAAAVLDAQVGRYATLPRTVLGLHALMT